MVWTFFPRRAKRGTYLSHNPFPELPPNPYPQICISEMKLLFLLFCSLITIISAVNDPTEILQHVQNRQSHSVVSLDRNRKKDFEPKQAYAFLPEESSPNRLNHKHIHNVSNVAEEGFSPLRLVGVHYLTSITIGEGSTAQTFNLAIDLLDSDIWVLSDQLTANEARAHNGTLYKAGKTSTSKIVAGELWQQPGPETLDVVAGGVYTDTVSLGGLSISNAIIQAVNSTAIDLTTIPYDGVLGLGTIPTSATPNPMPRLIDQMINSTNTQLPVFTTLFTRRTEPPGFITFGYINSTFLETGIEYTPILTAADSLNAKFWAFDSEFAIVNKKRVDLPGFVAFVSPDFPGIATPISVAEPIYEVILGSRFSETEGYIFPASTTHFPNVSFPVGKREIRLQNPVDFILGPSSVDGYVVGTIQPSGIAGASLLGAAWLQNVYAVFDFGMTGRGNLRFGVVPRTPQHG